MDGAGAEEERAPKGLGKGPAGALALINDLGGGGRHPAMSLMSSPGGG